MKKFFIMGIALLAMQSCVITKVSSPIQAKSNTNTKGSVIFSKGIGKKVKMVIYTKNLTPGEHAVHIHEKGDCSAPDGTSAGGHWNPTKEKHGKWGHGEHHKGDIGNLIANEKGEATLIFQTDAWCLGCNDETKNIIGKSIIIHAKGDDFKTQPTGDAGGRVGCVEIK